MRCATGIVLILTLLGLTLGYPTPNGRDPEQGEYFEGDLVLSPEQRVHIQFGLDPRNGLVAEKYRWPERKVYYKFYGEHFDDAHRNHVLRGMQLIEEASCIRFYPAGESATKFINITGLAGGCYSNVGYLNKVQVVNFQVYDLDTGCFRLATIVHEFLHSLGFYHQQSASDRDDYVRIAFENVEEGKEHNFNIYDPTVVTDFGIKYDYGSVMHYSATAFSKNGQKTIIPLDPSAEIGQRRAMSDKDIQKLNIMYKCPIPV